MLAESTEAQKETRDSVKTERHERTEVTEVQGDTVVLSVTEESLRRLPEGAVFVARGRATELTVGRDTAGVVTVCAEVRPETRRSVETREVTERHASSEEQTATEEKKPPDTRRKGWRSRMEGALTALLLALMAAAGWRIMKR